MEILSYINEIWKPIPGYFGLYMSSNYGRIKSLNYRHTGKEQILTPSTDKCGYLHIRLWKNKKKHMFLVHRLIWTSFNGPIPKGMEINHLNEDKTDNRLENLNLLTRTENVNWGTRNKRAAKTGSKMIEQYTLDGIHICTWFSMIDIEREFKHLRYNAGNICKCCQGKSKTAYGFIWKYAEN